MSFPRAQIATVLAAITGLLGCGASSKAPPSAVSAESSSSAPKVAAVSPVPPGAVVPASSATAAQPNQSASTQRDETAKGQGAAPPANGTPATSDQETFPSGLVVDLRKLGGPAPGPDLPRGTRVLHVGDSFAGALGVELNKVLTAAGLKSRLEFEKSTYIPTWAHSAKLSGLLSSFKPDLVLISLGANELENPEPEKRAPLIQKLVNSFGETPCVWIAPVLWEGAKATLLEVIRANVGRCVYLDSNELVTKMPRAGDKIHPSMAARPDWAAATARWLAYHRKPTEQKPWTIGAVL